MSTGSCGRVVAIVQARASSSRLPGKVLLDIEGKPMLVRVAERCRAARLVDDVVVATSDDPSDDPVVAACLSHGLGVVRGSLTDVLDRFVTTARTIGADVIVRVTADCPLIDPEVIDRVVRRFLEGGCDYASNTLVYTYPEGLDVEVFSRDALELAARTATSTLEREHVTPYLRRATELRRHSIECAEPARRMHWSVDRAPELEFARQVYRRLGAGGRENTFGYRDVLALLEKEPRLMELTAEKVPDEGYFISLLEEPPIKIGQRTVRRSLELRERARALIPGGAQTISKAPSQFVQGVAPVFLERGQGARVWDVDGNEYVDLILGLGPVILGHADPQVSAAVAEQLRSGIAFSLPHPLELEVAQRLVEIIPCAEMVRFAKNGSDVTAGAVRAARAFTDREIVACCGYHGSQEWYIASTTRDRGVPKALRALIETFRYNDLRSLEAIFERHPGEVAAVIMEPFSAQLPAPGFLEGIRDLTRREGSVLIFDEVVTGFRLALGGAQEHFGVTPDLACVGKAMGNGMPIAAVVGRRDIMMEFDRVFFSYTAGGEAASLAAARATIDRMRSENVIGTLWQRGARLQDGYNFFARHFGIAEQTSCVGLSPRTVMTFTREDGTESLELKSLIQQEVIKRGVLFAGYQNTCAAMSETDVEQVLLAYRGALEVAADALRSGTLRDRLDGPVIEPVFRRI